MKVRKSQESQKSQHPNSKYMLYANSMVLDDEGSVCGSVYDEYDPYDFIYSGSGNNSLSDPMYAAVVKSENAPLSPPPPLPPRAQQSTMERRQNSGGTAGTSKTPLYDSITPISRSEAYNNSDLLAFHKMVQSLRSKFLG